MWGYKIRRLPWLDPLIPSLSRRERVLVEQLWTRAAVRAKDHRLVAAAGLPGTGAASRQPEAGRQPRQPRGHLHSLAEVQQPRRQDGTEHDQQGQQVGGQRHGQQLSFGQPDRHDVTGLHVRCTRQAQLQGARPEQLAHRGHATAGAVGAVAAGAAPLGLDPHVVRLDRHHPGL